MEILEQRIFFHFSGELVAVKILESVAEVVEEVETEYRVLRDLGGHPNVPQFYGIYLKQDPAGEDQIWIAMEVGMTYTVKPRI